MKDFHENIILISEKNIRRKKEINNQLIGFTRLLSLNKLEGRGLAMMQPHDFFCM
jgi:hypothetical protein